MIDTPFMINGSPVLRSDRVLETAACVARTLSCLPQAMSEGVDGRAAQGLEHLLNGLTACWRGWSLSSGTASKSPSVRPDGGDAVRRLRVRARRPRGARGSSGDVEGRPPGSAELRHVCREQDKLRTEASMPLSRE